MAAGIGQNKIGCRDNTKNHITGVVLNDSIRMCEQVVKKLVAGPIDDGWRSLAVGDFIQSWKNSGINSTGIIEKGTSNRLDALCSFLSNLSEVSELVN